MTEAILTYDHVTIEYTTGVLAARDVSFEVARGECLALVGESGCGKTTLARAALGLLPPGARVTGSIVVGAGTEVVGATQGTLRNLRGIGVGFVAQDPFEACNPLDRVEAHVAEAWRAHGMRPPADAIVNALTNVGISRAVQAMRRYPHQWSGGMLQRATIAAATAHRPPLIVADEPTSALDAELADAVLDDLRRTGASVLLISHDIGLVSRHADRVAVLYAGRVVETAGAAQVVARPRHPYTIALLRALPRPGAGLPEALPGAPPDLSRRDPGCAFAPRCPHAQEACHRETPPLRDGVACIREEGASEEPPPGPVGDVERVAMTADLSLAGSRRPCLTGEPAPGAPEYVAEARSVSRSYDKGARSVRALVSASLRVKRGEIVGISGPSGCGKSTLLRLLATVETPTDGEVYLGGNLVSAGGRSRVADGVARRGYVMPIFQDPVASLDRRWPIWRTVTEPLMAPHRPRRPGQRQRQDIAAAMLERVGLRHVDVAARPDELSGGQCQRVSIARALVAEPALLVADEPTSALDVSVAAAILRLLAGAAASGTAIVIVSHDAAMLGALCGRVLRMSEGVLET